MPRRPSRTIELLFAFALGLLFSWSLRTTRSLKEGWAQRRAARQSEGTAALASSDGGVGVDGGVVEMAASARAGHEALAGIVRVKGRGVGGVRVIVSGAPNEALSDANGNFRVEGLRPGRHALRAIGVDVGLYRDGVDVPSAAGRPLDLALAPAPPLHGRIVDDKGAPLAGVEVTLREGLFAPLPRSERSDAAGAFQFSSVGAGRYLVGAAVAGFVPSVEPARAPAVGEIVLRLAKGATLVGDVVDETGRPVAGARVALVRDDGWSSPGFGAVPVIAGAPLVEPGGELGVVRGPIPYPPLDAPPAPAPAPVDDVASMRPPLGTPPAPSKPGAGSATADAMGHFRLGDLPAGKVMVVATHPAYVDTRADDVELTAETETTVRLTMRAGLALRGHVIDGANASVAGAELWVNGQLRASTDKRGHFELRRLPGIVELEVRARGHTPSRRRVDPRSENDIELSVGSAAERVTGMIVNSRGQPIAGARVTVQGREGAPMDLITDANGEFAAVPSPPGPIKVRATHGDHLPAEQSGAMPGDDVRLMLAAGGVAEGEVMDDRGALPSGIKLFVDDTSGMRRTATIDRGGRFRVAGLAPGPATVGVDAPSYVPVRASVELPAADLAGEVVLRGLRFTLVEAGTVMGSVRDRFGSPVVGAQIEGGGARTHTDGSGHFSLGNVAVGRIEVSAHVSSGGGETDTSEWVTIERGRAANVDLRTQ